jgi:predicted metalloenzyme YecM
VTDFEAQIDEYAQELQNFIARQELPDGWFKTADHVAVKGADAAGFEALVEHFRPLSERISCVDMSGRRLATAQLKQPVIVGTLGAVSWVEIMEPRPEKVGKDVVGFEHMEFLFPDFSAVQAILDEKHIAYEMESNPGHSWVNIKLNERGQELKLNDRLLGDAVTEEIQSGKARIL